MNKTEMDFPKKLMKKLIGKKDTSLWSCKQKLFDFSFKNPFFYIFTWSSQSAGIFHPYLSPVARAKTLGINIMDASYLVSVAGKKAYFYLTPQKENIFYKNWLHFIKKVGRKK